MSRNKDDKFSIFVPQDDTDREMPDQLELRESYRTGERKQRLVGGAYDPYQKDGTVSTGDTARTRKPRVDLRKLSDWIKTTQQVKAMREEDLTAPAKADDKDTSGK